MNVKETTEERRFASRGKRFRRIGLAVGLVSLSVLSASPAVAASVAITPNATLASGQSRAIGAAWGSSGPYKVNFVCNVAGCANFSSNSTTVTSLGRTVALTTCTGANRAHTITITENAGAGASASAMSRTIWTAGAFCQP